MDPTRGEGAAGPDLTSLLRQQLALPPPRPQDTITLATADAHLRSRKALRWSLLLLLGTIVAMIVLPPSGPRRAVNYAYMLCVLTMTGGFIWLAMALYFRSHWRVFADLVRDAPLLSGEVEGISRSSRGMEYLHVLCTWPDGSRTRLRAEGQPFSTLCHVEQELPCLCTKGKYSAVLLPNDELALAVTKRLST